MSGPAATTERDEVGAAQQPPWVRDVLRFWFEELSEPDWWSGDPSLDARVRERFSELHARVVAEPETATSTPPGALATVIVLDQFSRHLFRGDARAYVADPQALRVARAAIAQGLDAALGTAERMFLYLPFEHSEQREDQELAVALMERLDDASHAKFARQYRDVIHRFGRFPHRNAALGRVSTPEELEFLAQAGG